MAIDTGLAYSVFSWSDTHEVLLKIAAFVLVQALVYLILSKSSDVFSKSPARSTSFKPARSVSIRRFLAALSDMPAGGEPSPSSRDIRMSPKEDDRTAHEHAS